MELNKIYNGDCLEVLKGFPDNSIDSCVTDPPYGISFMNKHWDYQIPLVEVWKEVLRVLKPGGYILCACGTRTQHRMAVNIEDAGFEIRDVITWHYGSGFPKSLDIGKAVDKLQGNDREPTGEGFGTSYVHKDKINKEQGYRPNDYYENNEGKFVVTKGNSEWEGWGTALKPATEFWTLARKPLGENTVAANVLKYGTGGLNIDGSRIDVDPAIDDMKREVYRGERNKDSDWAKGSGFKNETNKFTGVPENGRFPANVIFDEFTGKILDEQTGILTSGNIGPDGFKGEYTGNVYGKFAQNQIPPGSLYGDSGGASRFFYCPKADGFERNKGVKGEGKFMDESREVGSAGGTNPRNRGAETKRQNHHPTVKPIDLMRYLVKLVTVKGGTCIDPYCGSGTTLIGAKLELINYIGIDRESEYCKIAEARVASWNPDKYKAQTMF